jgi:hypothetical protein
MKDVLIEFLYRTIKIPYQLFFKKNKEWKITTKQMLQMPTESLGFQYACYFFIQINLKIFITFLKKEN